MSYSHTKKRKLIAKLKRKHPGSWRARFEIQRDEAVKRLQGQFMGRLSDVVQSKGVIV